MVSTATPSALRPTTLSQTNPAALAKVQDPKNVAQVKKAAKNFEAMYVQEMLQHMWDGVQTDKEFGGGHGEEIFRSLMIEQYGKIVADSGQTKISDMLAKEMLRMQEKQLDPRSNVVSAPALKTLEMQASGESHE